MERLSWFIQVGPKCSTRLFIRGKQRRIRHRRTCDSRSKRLEQQEARVASHGCRRPPEARKGKDMDSPQEPPEGASPAHTLMLAQSD